jgi:P4 family phage/plasmid primase-like protien
MTEAVNQPPCELDVYRRIIPRWDVWSKQDTEPNEKGRFGYRAQKRELTGDDVIRSLVSTGHTIGVYTVKPIDNTVVNPTIDIDNHDGKSVVDADVKIIYTALRAGGMFPYIEASAGELKDGAHVGVICKPTLAATAKKAIQQILQLTGLKHEVNPKQESVAGDGFGNLVKLMWQYNNRTKARSQIIDPETWEPMERQAAIEYMMALPDTFFESEPAVEIPPMAVKEVVAVPSVIKSSDGESFVEIFRDVRIKPCIARAFDEGWELHGKGDEGHEFRLAAAGNLLYNGVDEELVYEYFRKQKDFSRKETEKGIKSIRRYLAGGNNRPMGCPKIKERCPTLLNGMCKTCSNNPDKKKKESEGKRKINIIPIPEIGEALKFTSNFDLAVQMQRVQPLYFDKSRSYWLWDKKELYWRLIDKTDILNSIVKVTGDGSYAIGAATKGEIIEAIGMTGRNRNVQEVKEQWVYCKNGVYDSESKQIFAPTHDYFFTQPIPHNIGDSEDTPTIDRLFKEWMGDQAPILYEICAYCLYNGYPIHRMFWLYGGTGRNGKDQFLEFLQRLVGTENAVATDLEILLSSRFESSKLYKKKLAVISETNFNVIKNSGLLKALTGHSYLRGEFKGKDGFDFYNTAKIVIATNGLPETTDKSKAFFARCVTLEFKNRYAGKQFNKSIINTIPEDEYENLIRKCFNKILPGLLEGGEFFMEGTEEEKEATYERISNPFLMFREKALIDDINAKTPVWVLRDLYNIFCIKNNHRSCGIKEFTQILVREDIETGRMVFGDKKWNTACGIKPIMPYVYDESSSGNTPSSSQKNQQRDDLGLLGHGNLTQDVYVETRVEIPRPSSPSSPKHDNFTTELTQLLFEFQAKWGKGGVNSSNETEFSLRFVDTFRPQWQATGETGFYTPSDIKGIIKKLFKITPDVVCGTEVLS